MATIGQVIKFDPQSDVFQGEYRLVQNLGKGSWMAEYVEPSDELIEDARRYYLESDSPYLGYHDPFGPERRRATRQESFDDEIMDRIERSGRTFKIRFVSAARFAEAF